MHVSEGGFECRDAGVYADKPGPCRTSLRKACMQALCKVWHYSTHDVCCAAIHTTILFIWTIECAADSCGNVQICQLCVEVR
jgi:hypothetical protein